MTSQEALDERMLSAREPKRVHVGTAEVAAQVAAMLALLVSWSVEITIASGSSGGPAERPIVTFLAAIAREGCVQWVDDAKGLRGYAEGKGWTPATRDMADKFTSTPYQLLNGWTFEFDRRPFAVMQAKNPSEESFTCSITTKNVTAQDYAELTSLWDRTVPLLRHLDKSTRKKLSHLDAISRDEAKDVSSTISFKFENGALTVVVMATLKKGHGGHSDGFDKSR